MKFKGTTRKQCDISGLIVWQVNLEKKGLTIRRSRLVTHLTEKNHIFSHEDMPELTIDYHQQFDNKDHTEMILIRAIIINKRKCQLNNDKIEQECEGEKKQTS